MGQVTLFQEKKKKEKKQREESKPKIKTVKFKDCKYRDGQMCMKKKRRIRALDMRDTKNPGCWEKIVCEEYEAKEVKILEDR